MHQDCGGPNHFRQIGLRPTLVTAIANESKEASVIQEFNPAPRMPLLPRSSGRLSSEEVTLTQKIYKTALELKEAAIAQEFNNTKRPISCPPNVTFSAPLNPMIKPIHNR